jgi:hypothetical protein
MSRGEGEKPGGSAGEEGEGDEAPACRTVPYRIHFLATEPRLSSAHLPGIRFGSSPFWRSGDPSVGRLRSSLDGSGRESPEFPLFAHTQAETNRDIDSQVETKLALTRPSFNAFSEKPCDAMRAASCVMRRACRTPSSSIRTRVRQRVLLPPPPPHSGASPPPPRRCDITPLGPHFGRVTRRQPQGVARRNAARRIGSAPRLTVRGVNRVTARGRHAHWSEAAPPRATCPSRAAEWSDASEGTGDGDSPRWESPALTPRRIPAA